MKKNKFLALVFSSLIIFTACNAFTNSSTNTSSSFIAGISSPSVSKNEDSSATNSHKPDPSIGNNSSKDSSTSNNNNSVSYQPSGDTKWNINVNLRGNAFRDELESLIKAKRTRTTDYSSCLSIGAKAAAYGDSGKFVPFYHSHETLTTQSSCNREHTWPNSRGSGKSGAGSDPFIIRPTLTSDNSSRGNNFYGLNGTNEWDPSSCGFMAARGESARVILYAATAYHKSNNFELSNNPADLSSANTMGTLKYLIQWNKTYPVTDIEKQINDYLDSQGYGRNPFVDHPEYAEYIWNENGLLDNKFVGDDSDPFENAYNIENDLSKLANNSYMITSTADKANYFSMNNIAINDSNPWYLQGISSRVNDDLTKMMPSSSGTNIPSWKFTKASDGTFNIYNESIKKYLYTYVSGTHYNIGLTDSLTSDGGSSWTITSDNGKGFFLKSGINIYLEYYKSSFCGYNHQPTYPIYLYR